MIRFDEMEDKTKWNEFLSKNGGSFTQSYEWGEIQKSEGAKPFRFFIFDNDKVVGCLAIYVKKTPFGSYGYVPRGPAIGEGGIDKQGWEEFRKFLNDFSDKNNLVFMLFDPLKEDGFEKFRKTKGRQPKKTIFIDLTKSSEELFKGINKTKRYGIRHAESGGAKVRISDKEEKDFSAFWQLMQKTAKRKQFGTFREEHFKNIFKEDLAKLFLIEYEGEIEAAAEVIFCGNTATYLHAGTSGRNERLTASYLLIWEIIKAAKDMDLKYLDLWGIDEKRYPGVTAFKKSFGGYEVSYPDARIVVNKKLKYLIYKSAHLARRVLSPFLG